jgi:hypothetical protein
MECETIKRFGLGFFDRRQNFVGLAELAVLDRLLRSVFKTVIFASSPGCAAADQ